MGIEPMNTGFADQRVSHFATGAFFGAVTDISSQKKRAHLLAAGGLSGIRRKNWD